ncbi:sensor histidine kinase [Paenibacillus psychroresistens]|uniref:histidine kinase n=1 Tax=Paenibacillus psychroresistens TaxID=1778678 RepID=A0A6B8RUZ2_9BACL|nr:HAMP domain-containing sensor histidine kinase [Paenibacillus psychroresistens]QGQ99574.1 sensor histidine kinase [Paenibacillus psychroresistens]
MSTKTINRPSMLRHWTYRYVIILCIGLLSIGLLSFLWVRHSTVQNRLQLMQLLAQELAEKVTSPEGSIKLPNNFGDLIDSRQRFYHIPDHVSVIIKNNSNQMIYSQSNQPNIADPQGDKPAQPEPPKAAQYTVSEPILYQDTTIGTITIGQTKKAITKINQESRLLALLLGGIGLLGWLVIYLILQKLTRPIRDIAEAAKKIEAGDYNIELQNTVKEKEIYELLVSFRGMAVRLEQLEDLRTELLAGVTHELKTPIASINGLIHAVRDKIVTGTEAEEFLDISIKETERLQQMVIALLDFNSFASGKINVEQIQFDLGKLLKEITYQWSLLYQDENLDLITELPPQPLFAYGDPSRIQQIIVNLLNNSRQALSGQNQEQIKVTLLTQSSTMLAIHVTDTGKGIPIEEQKNIFERYFRGGNKKLAVHGLGLGLTFSSMLANALNGKLSLVESSPQGTTFELLLPRI